MGAPQPPPIEDPPCPACGTPMGEDMQCPNEDCEAGQ